MELMKIKKKKKPESVKYIDKRKWPLILYSIHLLILIVYILYYFYMYIYYIYVYIYMYTVGLLVKFQICFALHSHPGAVRPPIYFMLTVKGNQKCW